MVLDGSLLPASSSIRDFQNEKAGYVADAVEQSLLLPEDMVDLRTLKKHEVFLSPKKDLAMVSLSSYVFFFFFFFTHCQVSFAGYSNHFQSQGIGGYLLSTNEG